MHMPVHLVLIPFISGTVIADIAKSRAEIEAARLLVYSAALQIDKVKAKGAAKEIGIAKVGTYFEQSRSQSEIFRCLVQFVVPLMACQVVDRAIQAYGAEGVSQDTPLASMYAGLRSLRIADVCCLFFYYYVMVR